MSTPHLTRTLVALLLLAGCGGDDGAGAPRTWSVVQEELPGALLSIAFAGGFGYAVGADDGAGPMVLRREGRTWSRIPTGASGSLWWVTPDGADLLLVGEGA